MEHKVIRELLQLMTMNGSVTCFYLRILPDALVEKLNTISSQTKHYILNTTLKHLVAFHMHKWQCTTNKAVKCYTINTFLTKASNCRHSHASLITFEHIKAKGKFLQQGSLSFKRLPFHIGCYNSIIVIIQSFTQEESFCIQLLVQNTSLRKS